MSREGQEQTESRESNHSTKTDDISKMSQEKSEEISSSTSKNQSAEPCRTPIERSLLAHFFFIFAISFFLGVIFLHSSLQFWSWQVNEINEYGPYGAQQDSAPSEAVLYQQNLQEQQYHRQKFGNSVFTIMISPNLTLTLTR